jgi:hypothetical protein
VTTPPPYPHCFSGAGDSTREGLRAAQALVNLAKELLMGIGTGEEQANAPGVTQGHRADFEEFEPDRRRLCPREVGSRQTEAADGLDQDVSAGGK